MRAITLLFVAALFAPACATGGRPAAENTHVAIANSSERPQTAIAHGPQEQTPPLPTGEKSKWTQGGEAMDTSEYDEAIAAAEKALSGKPTDAKLKKSLGEVYFKRAVALTDKRQYAAALGDYRRSIKYDPANDEAKKWIDQITMIYRSMNKQSPPEGEEPPPLSFKKNDNDE